MKIGVVRRGYSATGGAERYLQRFAAAAADVGHECVLFTGRAWPVAEWQGELVRVDGSSPRSFAKRLLGATAQQPCDALFSLERVLQCDVYRCGDGVHAAWLERRAAFEPRWRSRFRKLRPKHRELLGLERHLFSTGGAAAIIANSRMVRDEITARFDRSADDIHVIYNGVPPFIANPGARRRIRESLALSESSYVVLFAGSGWERKGLRFAVEAVGRVRDAECVLLVAGTGRLPAGASSAQIRFVGTTEKTSELLAAADVFLLPTIYDPFSNACLEAMAAGLPVITTRSNGFSEVIEEGIEGDVLDDPREIGAMARCLEAWRSSSRREMVRARLRQKSAHFSTEENMRKTIEVIVAARAMR